MNSKFAWLNDVSNDKPIFFILGPCVIESEEHVLKIADFLKNLSEKLKFKFVFKSSFDKANRTSAAGYRGIGIDAGLEILDNVKQKFEVPVITDIHESSHIDKVSAVADILQIPAFLCRQTDLLVAAGKSGRYIHVKKGQFVTPESMEYAIKKIESSGNTNVWLCERGYTMGYNNLVVDYRNFPIMKQFDKPIVFDATHAVQRPSGMGSCTSGDRLFVPNLAAAAIVQGIASVFMEVHDNPETAPCDGPNMIRLSDLERLLKYLIDLDAFAKNNPAPQVK
ncbi:MAG: 2-dehydro-3-deoxyphosphooctonate aldolase [candidate division TM6 bacterium GW2011_GWF2_37_49]|nr:MAG: 2-dehydro-3-deoxyphosphooctonate aldolase [candidate division TM6 bacterium GW2011_GWF2_37_49]